MMKLNKTINNDKTREFHGYFLDEWEGNNIDPCKLCELSNQCDEIADTLNHIEYCLCLSVNKKYKEKHPFAFFKKLI